MSNDRKASHTKEDARERKERVPLHRQRKFNDQVPKGYVGYWAVNRPGRIEAFLEAGWTFADESLVTSDNRIQDPKLISSHAVKSAGNGLFHYLMIIPEELFKEDQMDKFAALDENEKLLKPKVGGHMYGHLNIS